MSQTPNITAIVNAHREGIAARASLASLQKAIKKAQGHGILVEALAILDHADPPTYEVFESNREWLSVLSVEHGDLGKSRNSGVQAAGGKWVAFLDADDLWGANWLSAAFFAGESDPREVVWHPALNVFFDQYPRIFRHVDMEDSSFDPAALVLTNCWTALSFARRSLFIECPYGPTDMAEQIGFEDWTWNLETIDRGVLHKTVPDTGHIIHSKSDSLVKRSSAANCMPIMPDFFRRVVAQRNPAR